MANLATPEALVGRYRIEPNDWGKLESEASNRRSRLSGVIATLLGRQLQGTVLIGCSILTQSGTRAPDVAWASPEFMQAFGEITPYQRAPEICVEITGQSITPGEVAERLASYFSAGANEVWLVPEEGNIRYVGPTGDQATSRFPVRLSLPPPLKP